MVRVTLCITTLLFLLATAPVTMAQSVERDFAVAWTAGGSLYVLLPDDTAPRLLYDDRASIPRLSPDASHIAFQQNDSLYAMPTTGGEARVIFDAVSANVSETNSASAGRRLWLDGDTLLYGTFEYNDFGGFPNEDVNIADVATGEQRMAEIGGEFAPSPGADWIAVTVAGFYGDSPGSVHVTGSDGTNPREAMTYTAVATATEGQFAPQPQWVGTDAFRVAIPVPEQVYREIEPDAPPVALWEIDAITDEAVQIGTTPASFFGLPQWNDSGDWLVMLIRSPDDPNLLLMAVANGDGSNPVEYPVNELQGVRVPQWVPGGDRFVYIDGGLMLGGPTLDAPVMLDPLAPLTTPAVLPDGVVYAVTVNGVNEIRYIAFDGGEPVTLGTTGEGTPRVNAVAASPGA